MQDDGQTRFTVADLQAQLQPLLSGLFGVFQIAESGENQYVMKCIARLITFIGPQVHISTTDPAWPHLQCCLAPCRACNCTAADRAGGAVLLAHCGGSYPWSKCSV